MKYLGLDYGTKRIGIALSDEEGLMAFPDSVIENDSKLIENIEKKIKDNDVKKVIIGESKNYRMEDNAIMDDVYDLKKIIEDQMETDVELHPEVLTSSEAERVRYELGGKDGMLDASAAAIILQNYLDSKK